MSEFLVNIKRDVPIYQKSENCILRVATFRKGSVIFVQGADAIVRLDLEGEEHEFLPIPGELLDNDGRVKKGSYFVRTIDLPYDF